MPALTQNDLSRFSALLYMFVSGSPDDRERAWRQSQLFDLLPPEQKVLGHWYRYEGESSLIEVRADGSGQWHKDGQLPTGVTPDSVAVIPQQAATPTLLEEIRSILLGVTNADGNAWAQETLAALEDLPNPQRSERLVRRFQTTLTQAGAAAPNQLDFLRQAARQMMDSELLLGRCCACDVAGVLLVTALAEALAATDPETCARTLTKAADRQVSELFMLGAKTVDDYWFRGFGAQIAVAMNVLRARADEIITGALKADYSSVAPEAILRVYYGQLLLSVPYLLAVESTYHHLALAPGIAPDEAAGFAHKAETAEEKLVRVWNALLYAVRDKNLRLLHAKQAFIRQIHAEDPAKADAFVFETITLNFFYPNMFKPILLNQPNPSAAPAH